MNINIYTVLLVSLAKYWGLKFWFVCEKLIYVYILFRKRGGGINIIPRPHAFDRDIHTWPGCKQSASPSAISSASIQ